MAQDRLAGGCACGSIRYRLLDRPMFVHCCHCTSCQTQSGTAFALNALIESDRVETMCGSPEPVLTPTQSGRGQQVWRCPECRTALWSNYGGTRDVIRFVRVGTLDDPAAMAPDIHIFTRSRLPWVRLPEGALAVSEYYDAAAVWPAEALARRARALGS